jgi:NAD(P)-dependent dehydrogenase (short-subunit alcohol dehydrogenase family)
MVMTSHAPILITGAASGIGAALARLQGNRAVLTLDQREGSDFCCDLADPAAIHAVAQAISGPLAGVAHVAGIPGTCAPGHILDVNFFGARALTYALLPKLLPGAALVFVSSLAAHRCQWPETELASLLNLSEAERAGTLASLNITGEDAYALSKRLLNAWVPLLATRLLTRGIRANLVSPGPVQTPLLPEFERSMGAQRIQAARTQVGRHGTAEEIAQVISFMLSPASAWVNGIEIKVDGGYHAARAAAASAFHDMDMSEHTQRLKEN